jgi:hypothetical protein
MSNWIASFIVPAAFYLFGAMLSFFYCIDGPGDLKDSPLAVIWPIALLRAAYRRWRKDRPISNSIAVVYRYPARTWASWLILWTWRLGVTAALAWLGWRARG